MVEDWESGGISSAFDSYLLGSRSAMTSESKVLCQVRGRSGFPATALEVDDGDDLQPFSLASMRNVILEVRSTVLIKVMPQLKHLHGSVSPPPRERSRRIRPFPL